MIFLIIHLNVFKSLTIVNPVARMNDNVISANEGYVAT